VKECSAEEQTGPQLRHISVSQNIRCSVVENSGRGSDVSGFRSFGIFPLNADTVPNHLFTSFEDLA
jgi:hypothetical protein